MTEYSGGEVRLGTGQRAHLHPGGTVTVRRMPEHHFVMNVAHQRDFTTPVTQVRSATYQALVDFLKQLEGLDYLLVDISRVEGMPPAH
jgi:hypothetical protein